MASQLRLQLIEGFWTRASRRLACDNRIFTRSLSNRQKTFDADALVNYDLRNADNFLPIKGYDSVFLRDSCSCPRCVDVSTSQKTFETASIPTTIKGEAVPFENGSVKVSWSHDINGFDNHSSIFTQKFQSENRDIKARAAASYNLLRRRPWDRQLFTDSNKTFDYYDYLKSDRILHSALEHLQLFGIIFLNSVPFDPNAVTSIANRIGPLRNSLYGQTWDVRPDKFAKNVAYTSGHLGFHQDLLYMADPPGFQILHCMAESKQGGESLFTDAFQAEKQMDFHHASAATTLREYLVTYEYRNNGHWYQQSRPTFERIHGYDIDDHENARPGLCVNWSPPFQGHFQNIPRGLRKYLEAAKIFKSIVESDDNVFETKMSSGTCVIFDNRRILHARRSFSGGADRWLRGAYLDTDAFRSKLRTLNEEIGPISTKLDLNRLNIPTLGTKNDLTLEVE
ncbi:hypothetical protein MMC09_002920 [Bachmanniomyces sp. S44760]|nr:hypothetical protein [Bachmanniomyces sp. S44760]